MYYTNVALCPKNYTTPAGKVTKKYYLSPHLQVAHVKMDEVKMDETRFLDNFHCKKRKYEKISTDVALYL